MQALSSAGVTIAVRSARSIAAHAVTSSCLETSHTTTSPARLPASAIAATASAPGPSPRRAPERSVRRVFPLVRVGRDTCREAAATRPALSCMSGQRRPSSVSAPSTRSRPPPRGSQSTSSAFSPDFMAVRPTAAANTDAPAPPRAPSTASIRPASLGGPSAASASAFTSHGSAAGKVMTCSAPTPTAWRYMSSGAGSVVTTTTAARFGRAADLHWTVPARSSSTSGAVDQRVRAAAVSSTRSRSQPAVAAAFSSSSSRASSVTKATGRFAFTVSPSIPVAGRGARV